jgi:O-methyltransferase
MNDARRAKQRVRARARWYAEGFVRGDRPRDMRRFDALARKYSDFTMISPSGFRENLAIAHAAPRLVGDIVECGTWRGGMLGALAELLAGDRLCVGFDSFEGLPPAQEIDGQSALAWQTDTEGSEYHDNCTASEADFRTAMDRSGARYRVERGWFDETVPRYAAEQRPIALLRLDGDWYDSTMVCLQQLFPLVVDGGSVLIDDYYTWDGCTRAVHDYLSQTGASTRIRQGVNGVCVLRKKGEKAEPDATVDIAQAEQVERSVREPGRSAAPGGASTRP